MKELVFHNPRWKIFKCYMWASIKVLLTWVDLKHTFWGDLQDTLLVLQDKSVFVQLVNSNFNLLKRKWVELPKFINEVSKKGSKVAQNWCEDHYSSAHTKSQASFLFGYVHS